MLRILSLHHYGRLFALFCLLLIPPAYGLTLKCAIIHTLHTNPDVIASIKRVEQSHEVVRQARADYYPTLDVNAAYGREWSLNFNTTPDGETLWRRELGITLRQMLFDGFATRNEVARTMAAADAESYKTRGQTEDTSLAVAESYINVLRDIDLIDAGKRNLERLDHIYHMIKRRGETGVGRVSDTYQAEGRLELARSNVYALEGQLREDEIAFEEVTGLPAKCLEKPPIPPIEDLPKDLWFAVEFALGNHPLLKSAIASVEAARAQFKASKAPFFPRLDLIVSTSNNRDLDGVPGLNQDRYAIIQLQYNIFRGGKDVARNRETAFKLHEAEEIRNRASRQVIRQISLSWNAMTVTARRLPPLALHWKDIKISVKAYYRQFQVGRRSLIDLLNAENEQFTAAQTYINTYYLNLTSRYRVLNNTGGLARFLCIDIPCASFGKFRTVDCSGCKQNHGVSVMVDTCPPCANPGTRFYCHKYVFPPPIVLPVPCFLQPKCGNCEH